MNSKNKKKIFLSNKSLLFFLLIIVFISLPGKVKCFDSDTVSSFILWVIFILFTLAMIGYWNKRRNGYELIDNSIRNSTKL